MCSARFLGTKGLTQGSKRATRSDSSSRFLYGQEQRSVKRMKKENRDEEEEESEH